ncbi:MAG: hypothetical protein SF339_00495 [Blastocatellia bacterium]|nr:hypothetical protein [Blastocatellia bacterium]
MSKDWELTRELFEQLMDWLDPDRERAALEYERIRNRLVRFFITRGRAHAEDLADITINRVARKLPEILGTYQGEPVRYFYGIAKKVLLEDITDPPPPPPPPNKDGDEERTARLDCLDDCISKLNPHQREMVIDYYRFDKQAKILARKEMARKAGVSDSALKLQMHRLRSKLFDCVTSCLKKRENGDREKR